MPTGLKIEVVSPAKWERLRTSGAACECVEDSLGFADPTKQRAYVRDTAIPEVNKYLLNHELDHLLEEEGTDECPHGMRHKRGFFQNLAAVAAAPFTGGASLFSGSAQQHPVIGSVGGPLNQIANFGASLLPIGGGIAGGLIGGPAGAAAGAGLGSLGSNFAKGQPFDPKGAAISAGIAGFGNAALSSISGGGGAGGAGGVGKLIRPLSQSGYNPAAAGGINRATSFSMAGGAGGPGVAPGISNALQALQGVQQTTSPAAQQVTQQAAKSGLSLGGIGKGLAIGGGLSLIGDMFSKQPQAPDFSSLQSIQDLRRSASGSGTSPLGQLGQQQLSARLSAPFGGLEPGAEQSVRDTFAQTRRNLISQFKALRPNADLTSDSAYRQSLFELDQQEAQAMGGLKEQAFQNFQTTRTQDISQALGVDAQTVETLASIANLDVSQIMIQLGVDAAEAQQFKQTWSNLGIVGALGTMGAFSGAGTP